MFFLGLLVKGCSDGRSSNSSYSQAGTYQPVVETAPPEVKLPLARDGTVIAHPEKYIPKTVITQKPLQVSLMEGTQNKGTKTLPAGTELKLKAVDGYNLYVEIDGHWEVVDASATDLLEQMTQAAGDDS